ncbi:diflavin flavoprotein [Leptothoe sp. PORK10 BA2]|uniref:diflavin flavoprotein n=1 Tax=Leptothoe sp. PORK10 BA2 TaxID=3110254 RepID=UPI002B212F93|nr:diflavin flavoprotein [Leptothoe sp. PORK10 BA2]MEA5464359.1 diflavin flavoprotein [Leptothoe sp. PORK10 BA2]
MTDAKQRDVQVLPIAADTLALRSRSWNRLRFEVEYALEKGTTANSYLIQADRTALLDPPGGSFTEIFLEELRSHIPLDQLDYIILGHINPNRLETLQHLISKAPQVTIVCSNPVAIAIQSAELSLQMPLQIIKNADDDLDLGQGHRLQFMTVPTPRWPGGLSTYDTGTYTLFTDKFFAAHICSDEAYDLNWSDLLPDRRYYFDTVMAPNAKQVTTVLEKLSEFPAHLYAPGHGPMVSYGIHELTQHYQQWCAEQKQKSLRVALIYASAYGNTATIGQAIARGITKAGVAVESINAEQAPPADIKTAAETCAGFIIGSPTLGGHAPTQIQTALGLLLSNASKTKLAGVFGSYGWSGEAIDLLESKLRDGGYSFGFEPIRVKFKPDDVTLKYCEEAGTDFAQALKKEKRAKVPRTPASDVEKAVGRLVGSLCVVTAKQNEVASAMLASWVAQATFSPPGFTVSVAKERAIETLVYPGNPFVLNVLGEGKQLGAMKQFLKPFRPGENRFEGVDVDIANNGAYILKEAIAYLECTVKNRMDCGDHWVIYATIDGGQLLDGNAKTAVHHRKTGNVY